MGELKRSAVIKVETLSVKEFIEKYGNGVSPQAISYAMENGKLDYVRLGNDRFVVMTKNSKSYVPNSHPSRGGRDRMSTSGEA